MVCLFLAWLQGFGFTCLEKGGNEEKTDTDQFTERHKILWFSCGLDFLLENLQHPGRKLTEPYIHLNIETGLLHKQGSGV